MALVPNINAGSESSENSDSEVEALTGSALPLSPHSSPAPSVCSELMELNIESPKNVNNQIVCDDQIECDEKSLETPAGKIKNVANILIQQTSSPKLDVNENLDISITPDCNKDSHSEDVPLSPIIADVYPNPNGDPDYNCIPSISSLPSLRSHEESFRPIISSINNKSANSSPSASKKSKSTNNATGRKKLVAQRKTARTQPNLPSTSSNSSNAQLPRKTRSKQPSTTPAKKIKKNTKFTLCYSWKKQVFRHRAELEEHDENYEDIEDIESPYDYFTLFFSVDVMTEIVEQTNAYSVQETGRSINLSDDELRDFLAIHIMMGIVSMPSYLDYWSQKFRYPFIADIMPLKRYQQIRRYLHFADNNLEDSDRFYKVRPLVEKIRQNCLAQERETKFSIDEMMIPYKGTKAGKRRQYMKDKPTKWGFKNYVRAGVSGMIYDFVLYGAEDTFRFHTFTEKESSLGFGAQVVIALCKSIKHKPAIIYCDNFFSSPELFYLLREEYGIFGLGTIRTNRIRGAENKLPTEKQMKKKERGNYAEVVCDKNKLAIVKWHDNKVVTFVSSFVAAEPVNTIRRYCKDQKRKVDVQCPQVVKEYNKHMGGVDLADMLIALYKSPFKSRRWYLGIFAQMLDISINNAWLLQRRVGNRNLSLKEFRFEIYQGLLKIKRTPRGISDTKTKTVDSVRYDNVGHFVSTKSEGRCVLCRKNTTVFCIKCDKRLCFVTGKSPRNCHLEFHSVKP